MVRRFSTSEGARLKPFLLSGNIAAGWVVAEAKIGNCNHQPAWLGSWVPAKRSLHPDSLESAGGRGVGSATGPAARAGVRVRRNPGWLSPGK